MSMKANEMRVTVANATKGYVDKGVDGVFSRDGKLTVRPSYQREYVYNNKEREAVVVTVMSELPLGIMYWGKTDNGHEVIDGQQRLISICQYIHGDFPVNHQFFHNLTSDEQRKILDYELIVYECEGEESDKLEWYRTINIPGKTHNEQELRNATYCGTWLEDAKRYFSKPNCAAANLGEGYVKGSSIRQEILEQVLEWVSNKDEVKCIEDYMGKHQHDNNASELWLYYQAVIAWAKAMFPNPVKGIIDAQDWGILYNKYAGKTFDPKALAAEISKLNLDDDVTKKSGIIPWLLSERKPTDERFLSIRTFTLGQKLKAFTNQEGVCPICQNKFEFDEMEGDHIVPWSRGGRTVDENLQMLCKNCNSAKSGR